MCSLCLLFDVRARRSNWDKIRNGGRRRRLFCNGSCVRNGITSAAYALEAAPWYQRPIPDTSTASQISNLVGISLVTSLIAGMDLSDFLLMSLRGARASEQILQRRSVPPDDVGHPPQAQTVVHSIATCPLFKSSTSQRADKECVDSSWSS